MAFASFDAVSLGFDAVNIGPAGFGLSSPNQTAVRETVRLGLGYDRRFTLDAGTFLVPGFRLAWADDIVRDDHAVVAFGTQPFRTDLPRVGRDAVEANFTLHAGWENGLETTLGAEAAFRAGGWDAGGMASVAWHF